MGFGGNSCFDLIHLLLGFWGFDALYSVDSIYTLLNLTIFFFRSSMKEKNKGGCLPKRFTWFSQLVLTDTGFSPGAGF